MLRLRKLRNAGSSSLGGNALDRTRRTAAVRSGTIGERLDEAIQRFYAGIALHAAILQLAESTNLSPSQINRIRSGDTKNPRRSTLLGLAVSLNTTVEWLRDGVDAQQLDAFAITIPTPREAELVDPTIKVRMVLESMKSYPRDLQVRACRAAVSAALNVVAAAGQLMPEAYQSLAFLDGVAIASRSEGKEPV